MARAFVLGSFIVTALAVVGACDLPRPGAASPGAHVIPFEASAVPDVALHVRAGTRLRPRWSITPDGARELLGVRDTQLGIDCKFLPTPDGLRCVPDPNADETLSDTDTSFRDDVCSEPAAWGLGAAEPKFVVAHAYLKSDCPEAEMSVYRAVNPRRVTVLRTRYSDEPRCTGTVTIGSGIATAQRGPEITSLLVRGRRFVVGRGARDFGGLAISYIEAEDGAVVFDSWVDPTLDAPCTFSTAADGTVRCLPIGAPTTLFYDDTCTSAGATTRCARPSFILASDAKCSERTHVHRVGASRPGSYWLKNDIDCIRQTINATATTTYAPGAEIPAAHLTAATSAKDSSNHRLRANRVTVGAYRARSGADSAPWHDAKLDVDCRFAPAADGVERCLPWTAVTGIEGFSDPRCTSESRRAYAGIPELDCASKAAAAAPLPRYIRSAADRGETSATGPEAPLRVRVDELGPWPENVPLYVRRNRDCVAVSASELASMRTIIGEVAPAAFEAVKESIE